MKVHIKYPELVVRDVVIEIPDEEDIESLGFDDKVNLYNKYSKKRKADYDVCYHFSTVCNIQIDKV